MFCHCHTLKPIWILLDLIMQKMNFKFRFTESRKSSSFDLVSTKIEKKEEVLVIYLNSIVNFKIWKINMEIQHEEGTFNEKKICQSLIKTIGGRKNMEASERLKHCKKIPDISALDTAIKHVFQTIYPPR